MVKTKIAFIIFAVLTVIIFPYYIFILSFDSDFINSIIPGWHTTIFPARIISNLFKFLILGAISFYYWKLSKIEKEINLKKFLIHFFLTIPAILIVKLNIYEFFRMFYSSESFLSLIKAVVYVSILVNILFFIGQVFFVLLYTKIIKK